MHGVAATVADAASAAVLLSCLGTLVAAIWQPAVSWCIGLAGIAPVVVLSAWPVAVWAGLSAQWALLAPAVVVMLVHTALYLPMWAPWRTPAPAAPGWQLTVFDMNVLFSNPDLGAIAAQIRAADPDVIALQELDERHYPSLLASGVLADYPWELVHFAGRALGFGLWSRRPWRDAEVWFTPDGHPQLQATIDGAAPETADAGSQPRGPDVTVLSIHTFAPHTRGHMNAWAGDLTAIGDRAALRGAPVLVTGDFNATPNMRRFRALVTSGGLTDVAAARGAGWVRTWPSTRYFPPLMRLDHVLVSPDLTACRYRLGRGGVGSDHRAVVFTLARRAETQTGQRRRAPSQAVT